MGQTHYKALKYRRTHSFMLRHHTRCHPLENPDESIFAWEVLSKEPTCLRRQVSEALCIKESKDKETQQRTTIANQIVAEQTQTRIQNLKPKSEPESEPKPKLEQEPETESEPESDSESETEPEPEPEPRTQTNQNLQHNKRGKKKTKPEPPPEEYIF